jgi:hypothetical protein
MGQRALEQSMESYADLEIRILKLEDQGYPVEITLNGEQEFPRGYLRSDLLPWLPGASPAADGQRLFGELLSDDRVKMAWAEARGQYPQRRIRASVTTTIVPAGSNVPRTGSAGWLERRGLQQKSKENSCCHKENGIVHDSALRVLLLLPNGSYSVGRVCAQVLRHLRMKGPSHLDGKPILFWRNASCQGTCLPWPLLRCSLRSDVGLYCDVLG